ncbi:hypothetical protein SAMN04488540_10530 [Ferrimonas sediminum]|uniref:DUF7281 domain-containing protein n=1 Tax=Ferrimonas sediminum TaxID=718193 RepID=A0A1G8R1S2_9GAMM|nr:hypothetical protein [Ferrimonas sediminum]SDJ10922.1 hypothetical protein SAMN04488540_10530 [Ferrimonas sediminum]
MLSVPLARTVQGWLGKGQGEVPYGVHARELRYLYPEFGRQQRRKLVFTLDDCFYLSQELKRDGLPHPKSDDFIPAIRSREEWAARRNDEKSRAEAVSRHLVKFNTLGSLKINGNSYPLPEISCAGIDLDWREIDTLEHSHLVMVENLAVMTALSRLMMPQCLRDALFLYRGDIKRHTHTGTAYECFNALSDQCERVVFADFDPAGLAIAHQSGAVQAMLPCSTLWQEILVPGWQELEGPELRWFDQQKQVEWLSKSPDARWAQPALNSMAKQRQTRTQEHLLAHDVALALRAIK